MEVRYYKTYSENLQREVEYKTYGEGGKGVLVFPSQDQRFLFSTLLSLSGLFHADYFFPGFEDSGLPHPIPEPTGEFAYDLDEASALIYRNSPLHFLRNQEDPHLLIEQYRKKQIILCCGQGNYERVTLASTQALGRLLEEKNIPAWVDIWGKDVYHDFAWWRKQAVYFFDKIFDQQIKISA